MNINSPSMDGACQQFDPAQLENALNELTGNDMTAVVTSVDDGGVDLLCEATPCSPTPCQNGASCVLDESAAGGYQCMCRPGYIGKDCEMDEDECAQGIRVVFLFEVWCG